MNKKQFTYQMSRVINSATLYSVLTMSPLSFLGYRDSLLVLSCSLIAGASCSPVFARSIKLWRSLRAIRDAPDRHPLENIEKIVIDCPTGLESLLERTSKGSSIEWGCFMKSRSDEQKRAIVYEIMDIDNCQQELILYGDSVSMQPNIKEAIKKGYNGFHHYHPAWRAENYSITLADRTGLPENWINLLSFNMSEGPEIIGYNKQHIFIPTARSKCELVIATPRQIMSYLAN